MTTKTRAKRILLAPTAMIGTLATALMPVSASAATGHAHLASAVSPLTGERTAGATVHAAKTPATYTVKSGDTISAIAARFGLRTADVLSWNGLGWSSVIHPGQTIRLTPPGTTDPAPTATPATAATHTVARGDTVYAIAKRHGTTVSAILSANGIGQNAIIYPGQKLTIPGGSAPTPAATSVAPADPAVTHTVARGDTVYAIAKRHGTTVNAILSANGIGQNAIIYPGQRLTIPGGSAPASPAASATSGHVVTSGLAQKHATLDAEQQENARLIIRIGRELGVPDRGIAIALATAMVESWIRNLDYGDRDSLGLFQQRPSTGWGTPEQIRDRERSIRVFYGGPHDPNGNRTRGLLDIPGWESLAFTTAAQRVQVSAFPNRYGQWEAQAYAWLALYG